MAAGPIRISARVKTRVNRVKRVQEIVKIARWQKTVTSALVEVHSNFLAKTNFTDTQVRTKFKTTIVDEMFKELLEAIRMASMFRQLLILFKILTFLMST